MMQAASKVRHDKKALFERNDERGEQRKENIELSAGQQ